MLLYVIKYSVIFLNKQLNTDHKCCKILPNVEPRLHAKRRTTSTCQT